MHIVVKNVSKSFGNFDAAKDVSFEIEKGKLVGLLGPSGGGKTTLLRMLAGLEAPTSGSIQFDGKEISAVPPQERGIGFVFQNYALFRHMNVFDNIAFGLKVKKQKKEQIRTRVEELLELIGLKGLEKRYPNQLSGGQRQRVAFARALASDPQLLLLDEPFAAIDAKVRKELRTWLRDMISRVGITTIFVTHDQEEAVEVADEIIIMNQGKMEQKGTPVDIYKNPQTPFVASFIGESNEIEDAAYLKGFEEGLPRAKTMIRPEFIEIVNKQQLSIPLAAETGVVKSIGFRGTNWKVEVQVGPYRLFAYRSLEQPLLQPGEEVNVLIHRVYQFNEESSCMLKNGLKVDPTLVHH